MSDSPFHRLPVELFDLIIQHLPNKDRKSLRLTCRSFNAHSTPWAFRDLCVPLYDLDCPEEEGKERLSQLVDKYGHFVTALNVDYGSPLYYDRTFYYLSPKSHVEIDSFYRFRENLLNNAPRILLYQASLFASPELRVLQNLRSVHLEYVSFDEDEFHSGHLFFLIPSLEKLSIHVSGMGRFNLTGLSQFYGQSNLKSLILRLDFCELRDLEYMLLFPKSLTHLELQGTSLYLLRPKSGSSLKQFCDVLSIQRSSLEVLKIEEQLKNYKAAWLEDPLRCLASGDEGDDYQFDLSGFPRLREYQGVYPDTSGKFKQDIETVDFNWLV